MKTYQAVVIGAGPGGYVCAIRLAQLGVKTAIVEKEFFGGVCLNVGCIPSKALISGASRYYQMKHHSEELGIYAKDVKVDLAKMQLWKDSVVKKLTGGVQNLLKMNGVDTLKGTASFVDSKTLEVKSSTGTERISTQNTVIATGSRVVEIPSLPFNGKNILSSTEALSLTKLPKKLVVIGGGFIGLEIGTVYAKLGSDVTVVEALDQLLSTVDPELVQVVVKKAKALGIRILTSAKALGVEEKNPEKAPRLHLGVEVAGKKETLEADAILVSVGRRPNSDGLGLEKLGVRTDSKGNIQTDNLGQTGIPGVYSIGDVNGAPQLAHRASMDGLLVAATIAGKPAHRDYRVIPWAVFSDPEIGVCGPTEVEAKAQGIVCKVGRFPFAAAGRALTTGETDGLVKVLINEKDNSLVGVHIVGPEASNLISEAALAMEMGATVEDILHTIHTHPTLPEAFPEAIESAYNKAIHIYKPPRKS